MDSDKIVQELERRFAAPLPEFYSRRIIFWYDTDKEFEDRLDEINLSNAKIVVLTDTNNFAVKKLLNADDTESNFLVYSSVSDDNKEEDMLLDIKLYSEDFRADLISMWMDEMKVPQTAELRSEFKRYRKFMAAQARRNKVAAIGINSSNRRELQVAIMAALAGIKKSKPNSVIKAVLSAGLDNDNNAIYSEFVNYEIADVFWEMVKRGTGYEASEPQIKDLATHLLLSAVTGTVKPQVLIGLENRFSAVHRAYCYGFVSDWLHNDDNTDIFSIAKEVEADLGLASRFMKMTAEELADTELFPCINEVILIKLMSDIRDSIIDTDLISRIVEKRRTFVGYTVYEHYYEEMLQLARMQCFYKEHSTGFHSTQPFKVWKEYTDEYYIMDTYYREFHKLYAQCLKDYHTELNDLNICVKDKAEGLYTNWFLNELGKNWSDVCADELKEFGRNHEIPHQTDFYSSTVEKIDSRVYVIISDAMRYEVAATLAEQLRRETQSEVKLSSMQGIFPTITKFGMAALLPHDKLSVELKERKADRLAVLADGQSTEANYRDKVLKIANKNSVALQAKNIIGMKRADKQALVKGMDVVYIYQNTIDDAGHEEKNIFGACEEAIEEIKTLIRIIANDFGGARVLITSDHGFLYTYSPLTEDSKVDKTTETSMDIEIGRRYAIMKAGAEPQYLLPVKFLDGNTGYEAFAPRENIRIKMKGSGMNFVHGGISLQEMVVPLIDYHFLRNDSKEYQKNKKKYDTKPVEIALLSAGRKISNMIFSLDFYQKEPVSGNREECTYQLYFTNSTGKHISDTVKIIADKTEENGQDRTFRTRFSLKSGDYSSDALYYLVIADESGTELHSEEFHIDIAFALDDFNF